MNASERFTPQAAETLRRAIADAKGNEVFAAGRLDENGLVSEILVAARGGKGSVPALSGYLSRGDVLMHNHPSGLIEPSEADIDVASRAGHDGVGSFIVDNDVREVYVIAEPARARALSALDPDELSGVLEPGGKLAGRLPGYEARESQLDLLRSVTGILNSGGVLAAEAGTGVGKSFAYLLPAFAWAARNDERVVISTATINLQRQLMDKDIPLVRDIFRKKLKAVLVKGRGNYLCLARLSEALDEEGLFAGDDHPLRRIAAWAGTSASGDRSDLSFWPDDATWSRVASEADACAGLRCPRRESCFVLRNKRDAADANVLVANHHILFSDLAARMDGAGYEESAVLPPFQAIVFDEAHAIESSATSFFSDELSRPRVMKQLSRILRQKRERKFGLAIRLQNLAGVAPDSFRKIPDGIAAVRSALDAVDAAALDFVRAGPFRLERKSPALESALLDPLGILERTLLALAELLKDEIERLPDEAAEDPVVYEARIALKRLMDSGAACARFRAFDEDPRNVYWIDRHRPSSGEPFPVLYATPLDISALMNEAVFEPYRSVACVSATLAVGGSFEFWKRRVGLSPAGVECSSAIYPSPFPFERNALLGAADDAPFPDAPGFQEWLEQAVARLLAASGGRALVLFTSHQALRATWDAVKPGLDALGISAFRQGDDERSRLLDSFKADVASVLFATDSFWEGIDAPGETLELVVICKLPFRVPTDPVQKARAEAVEKRGGNAFMDLSLPEAVIRFKQGFGRLIRHSEDRGAVVVLDSRIVRKRYGELFFSSLPETRRAIVPLDALVEDIRAFIGRT